MSGWSIVDGKHILETEAGCAIIESYSSSHMTKLIIKDENGTPIDGYAQLSQSLENEKRIAESRLKQICSK